MYLNFTPSKYFPKHHRSPLAVICCSLSALLAGCCTRSIEFEPQITGSASAEVVAKVMFKAEFVECPDERQIETANKIKSTVADCFKAFADGKLSKEKFDSIVETAKIALTKIVLLEKAQLGTSNSGGGKVVEAEWRRAGETADKLVEELRNSTIK